MKEEPHGSADSIYKDNTQKAKEYFVQKAFEVEESMLIAPSTKKRKHRSKNR